GDALLLGFARGFLGRASLLLGLAGGGFLGRASLLLGLAGGGFLGRASLLLGLAGGGLGGELCFYRPCFLGFSRLDLGLLLRDPFGFEPLGLLGGEPCLLGFGGQARLFRVGFGPSGVFAGIGRRARLRFVGGGA